MVYGVKYIVLKQICQSVGLVINRYLDEARLPVALYHECKHFVLLCRLTEYFLAVHLAKKAECSATVSLQDISVKMFIRSQNSIMCSC